MTERVAFVDVDTQVDFMRPGGKLYAKGAEAIEDNVGRLLRHALAHGIPLVSSADCHAPGDDEFSQFPPHCLRGTPGQRRIHETGREVVVPSAPAATIPDPRRAHVLLEKQQFSLFTNPEAEAVLGATGARRMVVFGVVTEVCVRQAAEGLLDRGYAVDLVEDAVWPLDPVNGAKVLRDLEARGARRTTTASVLERTARPEPAA